MNYPAILLASLVSFVFGALWHGPVFGKVWMKLEGFTEADMKKMPLSPMQAMGLGVINTLVTVSALSYFVSRLNVTDLHSGFILAGAVWAGFVVTILANGFLWEGKPLKLFGFNAVYQLLSFALVTSVLVWMR